VKGKVTVSRKKRGSRKGGGGSDIVVTSKTNMWVEKRNRLDELDVVMVVDHPSAIPFKKSILASFPSAWLTSLVKFLGVTIWKGLGNLEVYT
jgi:hypothetical protein